MKTKKTSLISFFLLSLVFFPVFIFLFKILSLSFPSSSQWIEVLVFTFLQAGLSAVFSVGFGLAGALGLCWLAEKRINLLSLELLPLLPALLPPLVPVLAWVNVAEFFFKIPFSFFSVLIAHLLMNMGLVSVFFFRLFRLQTDELSAWAFLHKISFWNFLRKMLFFEWRKDLILVFLLVFSFCFTSFSVPLLLGGVSGQTLEVFIAEKLKNPADWPSALFLFLVETIFIFLFFTLLYSPGRDSATDSGRESARESAGPWRGTHKNYLSSFRLKIPLLIFFTEHLGDREKHSVFRPSSWLFFSCLLFSFLPSLLIFIGLGDMFFPADIWKDLLFIKENVLRAFAHTLLMGVGTGLFVFILLCVLAFCLRDLFLRRILMAYAGSSVAFMGFAFLLIGSDSQFEVWLKWCVGLSLLFLPALHRLMGESLLRRFKNQILAADLMGAGRVMSFTKIILPQSLNVFLFLSGVAAFWAVGDFAYSSIVAGEEEHLALLIQDLFSTYRFELATALTWFLIFTGMFCFSLFAGGGFVLRKKFALPGRGF